MRPILPENLLSKSSLLLLAGALALSACHKPEEEAPPADNAVENAIEEAPVNDAEPEAPTNNSSSANAAAPAPQVSQDQQMRDDADATGLTARLPEGGNTAQQAE